MLAVPIKVTNDQLTADEFNDGPMTELKNSVLSTGQTLTDSDLDQLSKSMCNYATSGTFFADTGIADAYVLNTIAPLKSITQYFGGMQITTFAQNECTGGPVTVNVNSLGIKTIKTREGFDPVQGDIVDGMPMTILYDGINFRLLNALEIPTGSLILTLNQSIASGAEILVDFDLRGVDRNSGSDIINSRFNPKVKGVYEASLNLAIDDITNAYIQGSIRLNGAAIIGSFRTFADFANEVSSAHTAVLVELNGTTDYIDFLGLHTDAGNKAIVSAETVGWIKLIKRDRI